MSDETTEPSRRGTHDDLLLDSTINYWWSRRWFIIRIMLIAVVVFAGCLFLIPKQYKAQASVIIMPPRFIPEVRTQPLTVTTAQSLLQTNELYQQVIVSLRRNRELVVRLAGDDNPSEAELEQVAGLTAQEISGATGSAEAEAETLAEMEVSELQGLIEFSEDDLQDMTIDSVAEMFTSEETVEKKTASELTYSPVLQLFAVADSGSKAQVMVNTWARLFEDKYEVVTRSQTQRLYESLESQQTEGQRELENIQKVLVAFKLENNLDLLQRQIGDYTDSFSSYSRQLVHRTNELVQLDAQLKTLVQIVEALEGEDGGWIGGVEVDGITTGTEFIAFEQPYAMKTDDDVPSVTLMRREALRSQSDLIAAMQQAAIFHEANPLELLVAEEERLRTEFLEQKTEYRSNLVKAEVLEKTLAEINSLLESTSQSLVLSTALPDEVVGQALAAEQARQVQRAASMQLEREQINPLWETLVEQRAAVSKEFAEAQAIVKELAAVLPEKDQELRNLSRRVFQTKQADEMVALRVERYDNINQSLFAHYTDMKDQLFSVAWRVTLLQEEISSLQSAIERTRNQLESLRETYEAAAAQIEVINLRKNAVEERAGLLTQKLQESLVAVGEQVSDVSLASKAVAPTRHFFPPRTILLALMTFLTGAVLLGGMSRRRYLDLAAARGYRAH